MYRIKTILMTALAALCIGSFMPAAASADRIPYNSARNIQNNAVYNVCGAGWNYACQWVVLPPLTTCGVHSWCWEGRWNMQSLEWTAPALWNYGARGRIEHWSIVLNERWNKERVA